MAEKPKAAAAKPKQAPVEPAPAAPEAAPGPKSRFAIVFKILSILLILCMLIAIGFAAGVYLKIIDIEKIASDANLAQHPVVARFLPKTNFEPVELPEENAVPPQAVPAETKPLQPTTPVVPPAQVPAPNVITKEEVEQQTKLRQKEEAKRISKLARLYGGMKPEAAVAIMQEMDDTTVIAILGKMEEEQVSKVLALFDASRAARISQEMLRVQSTVPKL